MFGYPFQLQEGTLFTTMFWVEPESDEPSREGVGTLSVQGDSPSS